ncbi:MAG: hypothetical protein GX811_01430, partial [Lentisphaerae bacterium]|nr:hypothetical protein [Lentisphaerota bacterium]
MKKVILLIAFSVLFTSIGFYSSAYSNDKKDEEGRFITVESIDAATGEIKQKTYDTTVIPDSLKTTGEMTTKPYCPDSNPDIIQSSSNNAKDIDSWSTVSNVNSYPYCYVTLVTVKYVDDINAYTGTGYMVGPDVMLTAAHVVKGDEDSEIENFKIYIKSSSSSPNSSNRRYWSTMY